MKTVLITGASSGIGFELANIFASKGYNLVLVARRGDILLKLSKDLQEKYKINIEVEELDLLEIDKIIYLSNKYRDIDILINNAGFGKFSEFVSYEEELDSKMIKLNIIVPTLMTKNFAKLMKKGSKIVNIASTAGHQPVPYMAVYSACKSYLIDFTMAISKEIKDIKILLYSPGETQSEFQKVANRPKSSKLRGPIPSSFDVARDIFKAIEKNKEYKIYGLYNNILNLVSRFLSRSFISEVISKSNEKLLKLKL